MNNDVKGTIFVHRMCCEQSKVGVPCSCFFCITRYLKVSFDKIMDVVMFDMQYLKLCDAKYGCDDNDIANILNNTQAVSECLSLLRLRQ